MDTHAGRHRPVATGTPGQEVFIDLVGPLPLGAERLKYCLTVEDSFTRHVWIFPIPNKEAQTVARVLIERYFAIFGIPHAIKSDNGREFVNNLMAEVADRLQLKQKTTPVYNPHSNGVERFHRTLNSMLRTYMDREDVNWPRALPAIMMAYNSKVHSVTQVTPHFATYGKEMAIPVDLIIAPPEQEKRTMNQHLEETLNRFRRIFAYMRKNQEATIRRSAGLYKGKILDLKRGDKVWYLCPRQVPGKPPKLTDTWLGPYKVVERLNDLVYRIRPATYEGPSITVHEQRLLKCTADMGTKTRIPQNLQIQDEGDELGEEIRPPGQERDEAPDDTIPVGVQGPAEEILDVPALRNDPPETDPIGFEEDADTTQQNLDDGVETHVSLEHDEIMPEPDPPEAPPPDGPPDPPPLTPPAATVGNAARQIEIEEPLELVPNPQEIQDNVVDEPIANSPQRPKRKPEDTGEEEGKRFAKPRVRVEVATRGTPVMKDKTEPKSTKSKPKGRGKRALSTDTSDNEPQAGPSGVQHHRTRLKRGETKEGGSKWTRAFMGRGFSSEDEAMDRIGALKDLEVLLSKDSDVPVRATDGSAAYDCWAAVTKEIPPRTTVRIPLRLRVAIPTGFFLLLLSRSGLASRGVTAEAGVIDSDYRGSVEAVLHNSNDKAFLVQRGQRICQGIFLQRLDAVFRRVEDLPAPDVAHHGFGSSGGAELDLDRSPGSACVHGEQHTGGGPPVALQ